MKGKFGNLTILYIKDDNGFNEVTFPARMLDNEWLNYQKKYHCSIIWAHAMSVSKSFFEFRNNLEIGIKIWPITGVQVHQASDYAQRVKKKVMQPPRNSRHPLLGFCPESISIERSCFWKASRILSPYPITLFRNFFKLNSSNDIKWNCGVRRQCPNRQRFDLKTT